MSLAAPVYYMFGGWGSGVPVPSATCAPKQPLAFPFPPMQSAAPKPGEDPKGLRA